MVLAIVDDLLFSSKIRAAAGAAGRTILVARGRDAAFAAIATSRPSLVIIDLDRAGSDPAGLIRELKSVPDLASVPFVGFGAHVHADRLAAARAAGCDRVLARSGFVVALPDLLRGLDPPDAPTVRPES
jgi:DNA-binding NarL/FixJ family response regulator